MTISVENCTNTGAKVFVLLRANCCTNCYYNFNPCGIFENMTSFSPVLNEELEAKEKLMAALYYILGNKGPKKARCNVRNVLKLGKISRKGLLCMKM